MSARIIKGKDIAAQIKPGLISELNSLVDKYRKPLLLVSVQVGDDPAITSYVKAQEKFFSGLNIAFEARCLDAGISKEELIREIEVLNSTEEVTGILLQRPLPEPLKGAAFEAHIENSKDVEGLNPINLGRLLYSEEDSRLIPCTARAVIEMLNQAGCELRGAEVLIVGSSKTIGKPLALLLLEKFATVTVAHIATSEKGRLREHVGRAEIIISAAGKPHLIKAAWLKENAVVIDVGTSYVDGRLVGDVEYEEALGRCSVITPVPGGVGPVTVLMLLNNLIKIYRKRNEYKEDS